MLRWKAENQKQRNELEGLAFHIASMAYTRERYPKDEHEIVELDKSIHLHFDILDELGVPYWVQNSVICFAENWRDYKEFYLDSWLRKNKNIELHWQQKGEIVCGIIS